MEPAKTAKIMQEFQRQSAQMDMTVSDLVSISSTHVNAVFLGVLRETVPDASVVAYLPNFCLQTEMMSDSIDDALDDDEAEEETEELTAQACSSIPSLLTVVASLSRRLPL